MIRKVAITLFLCIAIFSLAFGQNKISGVLKDTTSEMPGFNASVSLIDASDSILKGFTRANDTGYFSIIAPKSGKYLILIQHPTFTTISEPIEVDNADKDMGLISLLATSALEKEVVITDKRAIVIKGDTVEYTADSFKTDTYDNVTALLKKLPGIEVDRNGKIKAYGQEVKKILVDGEEFFSDDPAMVTEMLRASSVDKVQVYDKKSDEDAFTGNEGGDKTKTINLTLKEDAKKGVMGKASAGGGTKEFYQNQLMLMAFKGKRKLSAFGILSNTNMGGMGYRDAQSYSGGADGVTSGMDEDGGMYTYITNDGSSNVNYNGQFTGQGIPKFFNGGLQYANKWLGDSLTFGGSYKHNDNTISMQNNTYSKYILPDTQYINTSNTNSKNQNINNSISARSEYKLDSLTTITMNAGGSIGKSINSSQGMTQATSIDGSNILSQTQTNNNSTNNKKALNANILIAHKFMKKGRTISLNLNGSLNNTDGDGSLMSINNLYAIDTAYNINQRKISNQKNSTLGGSLTFTEPIIKDKITLNLNYGLTYNKNINQYKSLDISQGGVETYNRLYSTNYDYTYLTNRGGASVRFNFGKTKIGIGGDIGNIHYHQVDKIYDTVFNYNRINLFPWANLQYKFSGSRTISVNYRGSTQQPTIQQISPYQVNTNPMYITEGNPNLGQSFMHNLNFNYNSYSVLKNTYIYAYGGGTLTQHQISNRQQIDISGRTVSQYVNMDGNWSTYVGGGGGLPVIKDLTFNPNLYFYYSRNTSYLNSVFNATKNWSVTPTLSLDYNKTIFNISYSFSPIYNATISSVQSNIKTKYWTFNQNLNGYVKLPANIKIGTTVDWQIRQQLEATDVHNKVFKWDMYLAKSFLKDKSLELRLYANDILNQNKGFQRYNTNTVVSQSNYNTIRRYGMLQITWNFNTQPVKKSNDDEESDF